MTSCAQSWPAPAKLNLMLHITGRRDDGYHELQTVFQFLDIGDALSFNPRADDQIQLCGNDRVAPEKDLITRAARLLQQTTGCQQGADIEIDKRLPMGGGLGGGSSDAASCLHALNRLWQLNLSTPELAELGLQLGADVPVFVHGFAAFAEGVGERLTAIELEQPWYLVISPPISVATGEIFADPELTRDSPPIKICDLFVSSWDNVCTAVVAKHYPEVRQALAWLSEHAQARMSGSGASVFAAFDTEAEALAVQSELQMSALAHWPVFVARGCNQSPLIRFMNGAK